MLLLFSLLHINKFSNSELGSFTISVYANNNKLHELSKEKTTIDITTLEKEGTGAIGGISHLIFTGIMLNVPGENIDYITYNINKGHFIKRVFFTKEEFYNADKQTLENISQISGDSNTGIREGIKDLGNSIKVKVNEQNLNEITLALPYQGDFMGDFRIEDNIIINITVTFTDGTSEEKEILLEQESNSISFVLKS